MDMYLYDENDTHEMRMADGKGATMNSEIYLAPLSSLIEE